MKEKILELMGKYAITYSELALNSGFKMNTITSKIYRDTVDAEFFNSMLDTVENILINRRENIDSHLQDFENNFKELKKTA